MSSEAYETVRANIINAFRGNVLQADPIDNSLLVKAWKEHKRLRAKSTPKSSIDRAVAHCVEAAHAGLKPTLPYLRSLKREWEQDHVESGKIIETFVTGLTPLDRTNPLLPGLKRVFDMCMAEGRSVGIEDDHCRLISCLIVSKLLTAAVNSQQFSNLSPEAMRKGLSLQGLGEEISKNVLLHQATIIAGDLGRIFSGAPMPEGVSKRDIKKLLSGFGISLFNDREVHDIKHGASSNQLRVACLQSSDMQDFIRRSGIGIAEYCRFAIRVLVRTSTWCTCSYDVLLANKTLKTRARKNRFDFTNTKFHIEDLTKSLQAKKKQLLALGVERAGPSGIALQLEITDIREQINEHVAKMKANSMASRGTDLSCICKGDKEEKEYQEFWKMTEKGECTGLDSDGANVIDAALWGTYIDYFGATRACRVRA